MLEVKNVTKRFGGLTAVDHVSVSVKKGEILGIIGPNGAGKTTFLNCISGFYKPEEGVVLFDGVNVVGNDPCKMAHLGIGRTFQIVRSFPKMSALENVKVAAQFCGHSKNPEARARELLDFVAFPADYDLLAENFNIMQLKRLELARALATGCRLLLLDEVAAGLTPTELPDFIELIKKIRDSGMAIICIEHVMKFIMELCDHIIVLSFGKMIAEGNPEEIKNNEIVMEAYLGEEELG